MRPQLRIGILLATIFGLLLLALPAQAKPHSAQGNPRDTISSADTTTGVTDSLETDSTATGGGRSQSNSGNGMNRQGGPGVHPGKGWKDPGSVQGSIQNVADPDCTGNRATDPQPTNIGACDSASGAADKPGGLGGFDADKDFNNGCGNDTDFEDDNNGLCRGRRVAVAGVQPKPPPPQEPAPGPVATQVLPLRLRAPTAPVQLPATGMDFPGLLLSGAALTAIGRRLVRAGKDRRRG